MIKIPGFSRYLATDEGHILSTNYKNSGKTMQLKPALNFDGYLKTMLQNDSDKYVTVAVHRIIAFAYLGPSSGLQVNHINGIKTDNRPANLEYLTHSQNAKHSFDTGLQKAKRGELNGNSKLTDEDVINIRKIAGSGKRYYGRKALALKYGISEAHVKDIVSGRRGVWSHI